MNSCPTCQVGRLQRRNLVYLQWHDKGLLVVNHMPAVACDVCGERIYDNDALDHLQRLLWASPLESRKIASQNR